MNEYEYSSNAQNHNSHHSSDDHSHDSHDHSHVKDKLDQSNCWYNRDGRVQSFYNQREEEHLFQEHIDNLQKKKTLNIEALQKIEFSVTFNSEVQNDHKDIELGNQPLDRFESLQDIPLQLGDNIHRLRFDYMTPIQKAVIPYMQKGNDVMGCSETGSGKTIAYLFPVINGMIKRGPAILEESSRKTAYPIALILVPTRELADQVYKESRKMCYKTGINTVKVYGGVPYDSQVSALCSGCDILVATPGRLIDYLKTSTISLKMTNTLIIDEADRILDMGFEDQLNTIIFNHDLHPKEKRQNLMFSATFSPDVRKIARKFMNEFYFVQPKSIAPRQIKQEIIKASESEKNQILSSILQKIKGSIIIFLDTKRGVDSLSYFLYNNKFKVGSIHGDKKQNQRQNAIESFILGHIPILIATDVASRGLDFPNVNYVVNYDLPKNLEDYIHRIGRTGRMGQEGTAISFINEGNKPIIKKLYMFFKDQGQAIPPWFDEMYLKEGEDDRYKRTAKYRMNMPVNTYGNSRGGFRGGYMGNINRGMYNNHGSTTNTNGYRMNSYPFGNATGIIPSSGMFNMNMMDSGYNRMNSMNHYPQHINNTTTENVNVNQNGEIKKEGESNGFTKPQLQSITQNQSSSSYHQRNSTNEQSNNNSNTNGKGYNSYQPYQYRNNDHHHNHSTRRKSYSRSHSKEIIDNNRVRGEKRISKSRDKSPCVDYSYKNKYLKYSKGKNQSSGHSRSKSRSKKRSRSHNRRSNRSRSHDRSRVRNRSRDHNSRSQSRNKGKSRSRSRDYSSRYKRRNDSPKRATNNGNNDSSSQGFYYSNRNRSNDIRSSTNW